VNYERGILFFMPIFFLKAGHFFAIPPALHYLCTLKKGVCTGILLNKVLPLKLSPDACARDADQKRQHDTTKARESTAARFNNF
jgi:hypothetical protein